MKSETFQKFFESECVPVSAEEIVEPTRVTYKKFATIATKIFPTRARADKFVEEMKEGQHGSCTFIAIQAASEPPVAHNMRGHDSKYYPIHKFGKLHGWWKKR